MTEEPHDWIAISDRGVIGCCSDIDNQDVGAWIAAARRQGYRVERVPLEEAVRRHRAYLATLPEFKGLIPAHQDAPAA